MIPQLSAPFTPREIVMAKPQRMKRRPKRPKMPPREHALTTAEMGREIAAAIADKVRELGPADADECILYAERIKLCCEQTNIWHGKDLHAETSDPAEPDFFDASGKFWTCGQRLCPGCIQTMSRRNRRSLRSKMKRQRSRPEDPNSPIGLLTGQHWKFLTLTMVNPGLSLLDSRELIEHAWSLFRKRKWFLETIIGGCKAEEFTLTIRGYHYHLHTLVRSKYIDWDMFRSEWTYCVRQAFAKYDVPFSVANKDGLLSCKEMPVTNHEDGIQEVAKYITKSDSWAKMRGEDLLDLIRIERWPRMFEFFGSFRPERKKKSQPAEGPTVAALEGDTPLLPVAATAENAKKKTILDTTEINDGDSDEKPKPVNRSWRRTFARLGAEKYLQRLQFQIDAMRRLRIYTLRQKYKYATFYRHPGESTVDIERITQTIRDIYAAAGRPPPRSLAEKPKKIPSSTAASEKQIAENAILNEKLDAIFAA